ncbi:MAG: hypothetical protein ACTSQJ_04950 [Promethearchaeota archaeon]
MKLFIQFFTFFFISTHIILFSFCHKIEDNNEQGHLNHTPNKRNPKKIILLGASVGRAWNISSLPKRINNFEYEFEYVHGGSSFDKSEKLKRIINRSKDKPNAVFIKECAAFFPGNLKFYKNLIKKWIVECQEKGIIPIPTTVVPVTRLHALKKFIIDITKGRDPFIYGNPFNNNRNKAIIEYNNWIRSYCKQHRLHFLDLEEALRYSEKNRYLREDLARLDGLHLNCKAYEILDKIVIPCLEKINWKQKNSYY